MQSEINLYRKYRDFEDAGWDIMSGVRLYVLIPVITSHEPRAGKHLPFK